MPYLAKLVFCFSAGATLLTGAGAQGPQAAVAPLGRAIFGAIESSTLAKRQVAGVDASQVVEQLSDLLEKAIDTTSCQSECTSWISQLQVCVDGNSGNTLQDYENIGRCACQDPIPTMKTCASCLGSVDAQSADNFEQVCQTELEASPSPSQSSSSPNSDNSAATSGVASATGTSVSNDSAAENAESDSPTATGSSVSSPSSSSPVSGASRVLHGSAVLGAVAVIAIVLA